MRQQYKGQQSQSCYKRTLRQQTDAAKFLFLRSRGSMNTMPLRATSPSSGSAIFGALLVVLTANNWPDRPQAV